jgi:hypothetical protein
MRSVAFWSLCIVTLLLVGCAPASTPRPSFCDGIDAQIGGCDSDRAQYSGTTCAEVGREFGAQLDERLLRIYAGPDVANGESKAVRAASATGVTLSLANLHLRRIGIIKECGVAEFMAAAEPLLSEQLHGQAGLYLSDGVTVTYAEWLANLRSMASIIDAVEDAPVPGAS